MAEHFDDKADMRLAAKAVRERWPMPERWREAAVGMLFKTLSDANASLRDKTRAFEALVKADQLNMAEEAADREAQSGGNRFLVFAQQAGLPQGVPEAAAGAEGGSGSGDGKEAERVEAESGVDGAGEAAPEDGGEAG